MTFLKRVFIVSLFAISAPWLFAAKTEAAATPACALRITPQVVHSDKDIVTLSWETTDAYLVSIDNGIGAVAKKGSMQIQGFTKTTTYTLTAKNGMEITQCQATVVYEPYEPQDTGLPCVITATPMSVSGNGSVLLQWQAPEAREAELIGYGMVPKVGHRVVEGVDAPKTFRLQVTDGVRSGSCSVTVQPDPTTQAASPSCELKVIGDRYLRPGESTTLWWRAYGAVYAAITEIGQVPNTGELTITPAKTTTFIMVVRDQMGREGFCEETVEVRPDTGFTTIGATFGQTGGALSQPMYQLPLQAIPYTGVSWAGLWYVVAMMLLSWTGLWYGLRAFRT